MTQRMGMMLIAITASLQCATVVAFTAQSIHRPSIASRTHVLHLAKGFGSAPSNNDSSNDSNEGKDKKQKKRKGAGLSRSYGKDALSPIADIIDSEGAMQAFFEGNDKWHPLFRSMSQNSNVASFLQSKGDDSVGWNADGPWEENVGVPDKENDRTVLSTFLDQMQASLVNIPVDESTKEDDELDMHFLEEGRRVLVLSRFHVVHGYTENSIDSFDALFTKCWSELMHLHLAEEVDCGSLIIVPGADLMDLRRFTSTNLQQPLRWLGLEQDVEITAYERGDPAIRFIYKLSAMPTNVGQ